MIERGDRLSHAYVYWINDGKGDIIPVRDFQLTKKQEEGLSRDGEYDITLIVGQTIRARFGSKCFDAKVLQIGNPKTLSDAEETLFAVEDKLRHRKAPQRYGLEEGFSEDSDDGDETATLRNSNNNILQKKILLMKAKAVENMKKLNEAENFSNILAAYDLCELNRDEQVAINRPTSTSTSTFTSTLAETASAVVISSEILNPPIDDHFLEDQGHTVEEQTGAQILNDSMLEKENHSVEDPRILHLTQTNERLMLRIQELENEKKRKELRPACGQCDLLNPPQAVREYYSQILGLENMRPFHRENQDQASSSSSSTRRQPMIAEEKVRLVDSTNIFVTRTEKITILVGGKKNGKTMVSKFLKTCFTMEQLSNFSYGGKRESAPLPEEHRNCLQILLAKYHKEYAGMAKAINTTCASARLKWRKINGVESPGERSKYTPKTKRSKRSACTNDGTILNELNR